MNNHRAIALRPPPPPNAASAEPKTLFSRYLLGDLEVSNRLVMAPMTRSRAADGNVPNPLAVTYYAQRASAGLLVTEASQVSPQGVGYIRTPGIHSAAQVAGWRKVTDAVHTRAETSSRSCGTSDAYRIRTSRRPAADCSLRDPVRGGGLHARGKKLVTPRALETDELPGVVEQFRQAAENAREAGFDGVELHGSNGYLLDQFLRDGSNRRTDVYGGSIENRARFPLEVTEAVARSGPQRVGYRLAPYFSGYSMSDFKFRSKHSPSSPPN